MSKKTKAPKYLLHEGRVYKLENLPKLVTWTDDGITKNLPRMRKVLGTDIATMDDVKTTVLSLADSYLDECTDMAEKVLRKEKKKAEKKMKKMLKENATKAKEETKNEG